MTKRFLLLSSLFVASAAHAQVIDSFTDGDFNSGYLSSGSQSVWTNAASAVGGIRQTGLTVESNTNGDDARLRVIASSGTFAVSNGPGVDSKTTLGYGFATNNTTPGSLPLNFNFSNAPKLAFDFTTNDLAQSLKVTLYRNDSSSVTRTVTVPTLAGPTTVMADFTSDASSLSSVTAMTFSFDTPRDGDFSLRKVTVVPEPGTYAAVGLGMLVMLRRKRKAS